MTTPLPPTPPPGALRDLPLFPEGSEIADIAPGYYRNDKGQIIYVVDGPPSPNRAQRRQHMAISRRKDKAGGRQ